MSRSDYAILIAGSNDVQMGSTSILTKEAREKIDYLKNKTVVHCAIANWAYATNQEPAMAIV